MRSMAIVVDGGDFEKLARILTRKLQRSRRPKATKDGLAVSDETEPLCGPGRRYAGGGLAVILAPLFPCCSVAL